MRASSLFALSLAAGIAAAIPALGQVAGNMLADVGMLGRWAGDCAKPPGSGNAHTIFERTLTGTGGQYRVEFSSSQATVRSVDRVRVVSDDTIAMRFTTMTGDTIGLAFDITMLKEPKRYKVIGSVGSDGKTYIKDGIIVSSGQSNPWQNYCGEK